MHRLEVPRRVWAQIAEVKAYTERRFGPNKRREYDELIEEALVAIASDPARGKSRTTTRPDHRVTPRVQH
jgi:plasmid stabilization system protein ParE